MAAAALWSVWTVAVHLPSLRVPSSPTLERGALSRLAHGHEACSSDRRRRRAAFACVRELLLTISRSLALAANAGGVAARQARCPAPVLRMLGPPPARRVLPSDDVHTWRVGVRDYDTSTCESAVTP